MVLVVVHKLRYAPCAQGVGPRSETV